MNSRRNGINQRDHYKKDALFYNYSRKIGQNQKSAIVTPSRKLFLMARDHRQFASWRQ
jgi:hypothetical protein